MEGLSKYCKKVKFTGVDISKQMIKFGNNHISNDKIKFKVMSAKKIDFKNESFNYVLCKDSFHHFNNPVKVLKEIYRVLKKRGYAYFIDLRRDAPEGVKYQIIQAASELNVENAMAYLESSKASYTINEMRKLLKQAGIRNYKLFTPKIKNSFLTDYNLKNSDYLMASNYLREKWVLVINKS
jgi:ubiquinone/menaquinone biosynthesis C-methylase UbiE